MVTDEFIDLLTHYMENTIYLDPKDAAISKNIRNLILALMDTSLTSCIDGVINKRNFDVKEDWNVVYFLTDFYIYLKVQGAIDYVEQYIKEYMKVITSTTTISSAAADSVVRPMPKDKIRTCYAAISIAGRNKGFVEAILNINKA